MTARRTAAILARAMSSTMDQATYQGYRAGFEAARDEAARLADRSGKPALAKTIKSLVPRPDRVGETKQGT
jgi:hypothetical protein